MPTKTSPKTTMRSKFGSGNSERSSSTWPVHHRLFWGQQPKKWRLLPEGPSLSSTAYSLPPNEVLFLEIWTVHRWPLQGQQLQKRWLLLEQPPLSSTAYSLYTPNEVLFPEIRTVRRRPLQGQQPSSFKFHLRWSLKNRNWDQGCH